MAAIKVKIIQGDITDFVGDAIVNAANPALLGGGGVDGAIHRAAGPELRDECALIPEQAPNIRCRIGQVFTTKGYDLPAKHVLHTVGPIFDRKVGPLRPGETNPTNQTPQEALLATFMACLREADSQGFKSIALPAISCGVYGCPIEVGAEMAAKAVLNTKDFLDLKIIAFVLFTDLEYDIFLETFKHFKLVPQGRQ